MRFCALLLLTAGSVAVLADALSLRKKDRSPAVIAFPLNKHTTQSSDAILHRRAAPGRWKTLTQRIDNRVGHSAIGAALTRNKLTDQANTIHRRSLFWKASTAHVITRGYWQQ